jgi:carbohydrate phosphorylase
MDETTSVVAHAEFPKHYGSDPVRFSGHPDALLERHLLFNDLIDPSTAGARQTFEAAARSVRDVLSQRWALTQRTYHRENPKRVYYLSMEFLIGRSLTNNITNLMLDRYIDGAARTASLDWLGLIEQEPDAGLGNGGLGRLAACFLDSMATMQLPATGYGLRYEYGMFRQAIENGWQREYPDNWLHHQDPWEVPRPSEVVEVKLGCSFEMHRGKMELVAGRRRFRRRPGRPHRGQHADPRALSGRLDRDGTGAAVHAGILPGGLLACGPRAPLPPGQYRLERISGQGRHPAQRYPSHSGGARAHAHPARRSGFRLGRGLGHHAANPGLHQSHAVAGGARALAAALLPADRPAAARDHLRDQPPFPGRRPAPLSQATKPASRA